MKTAVRIALCLFVAGLSGFRVAADDADAMTADRVLSYLRDGNNRFVSGTMIHPLSDQARRTETASGQKPVATVLACSDSRESPELIFDAGLGELFVIRVAGNVADTDEIASIEYGTEHLHTPLVVVLGHTSCGAVTAVVNKTDVGGSLPGLLDNIYPAASLAWKTRGLSAPVNDVILEAVVNNVYQSIEDLFRRSPAVAELVRKREVTVVGALYHLDSGIIDWLGRHPREASLIVETPDEASVKQAESTPVLWFVTAVLPAVAAVLYYLLWFRVLISEKRLARRLRLKGRLVSSFFALVLALSLAFLWTDRLAEMRWPVDASFSFWAVVLVSFAAAVLWSRHHYEAFRKFIHRMSDRDPTGTGSAGK